MTFELYFFFKVDVLSPFANLVEFTYIRIRFDEKYIFSNELFIGLHFRSMKTSVRLTTIELFLSK